MSAFNLIESIHGAEKKPRTAQQWEEISRTNTQKVTQAGSNVPLAWVLVHGKNIPPNAIVAGEDKRRPLYIARTFYEANLGQAGQHLERGASFAYNGKEVHLDTYEVLVPLQQTIKYQISDSHFISNIPRISRSNDQSFDPILLQKLRRRELLGHRAVKIVMVVDDSISMAGTLWCQARSALTGLVSIIEADFNTNGIDLFFMNSPKYETNIRDRHRIETIFDTVDAEGATPVGRKLQEIFTRYLPLVEDPNSTSPPIIVMVITDGVPTDDVDKVIVEGARRLDRNNVPIHRFGISFVQIGNDPDAAEFLRELDDDISDQHQCRDMVDATPFDPKDPEFTREVFLKCVLGSIDPYYDQVRQNSSFVYASSTTSMYAASNGSASPYATPMMPTHPIHSPPPMMPTHPMHSPSPMHSTLMQGMPVPLAN
ncbi:hypothetical protein P691DRAFT_733578 [Macrolepiota fuliginosa MF-IS2]|uniref:VWFA domain-containing protein n=1 Tax=Macrolepiota fuliginosa MF-IS2 TaxID=1400762 RepID=A0A9P5XAX4_9AGAR|nr:hypothetical protein P691DRAFT_733578 [Macrolepiota fuliginosa MF-IS2]